MRRVLLENHFLSRAAQCFLVPQSGEGIHHLRNLLARVRRKARRQTFERPLALHVRQEPIRRLGVGRGALFPLLLLRTQQLFDIDPLVLNDFGDVFFWEYFGVDFLTEIREYNVTNETKTVILAKTDVPFY